MQNKTLCRHQLLLRLCSAPALRYLAGGGSCLPPASQDQAAFGGARALSRAGPRSSVERFSPAERGCSACKCRSAVANSELLSNNRYIFLRTPRTKPGFRHFLAQLSS